MNEPKPFCLVDVYAGDATRAVERHVNCSYSLSRGFFEPITNISFKSAGLKVEDWHYSPVALWPGAKVFHRKRGSEYTVCQIVSGLLLGGLDGETVNMPVRNEFETVFREDVHVQVSTENHSPEWAIYKNDEGMHFVRPLSEFTEDRFKILYNGA